MRVVVVRLLLLLLPLQLLWAGAALACQHEPNPTATHFGHHAFAKTQADQTGDTKVPSAGSDCSVCHLASSQLILSDAMTFRLGGNLVPAVGATPSLTLAWPDRPERPNWHPPS